MPGAEPEGYRLVTDLLGVRRHPAAELAALYRQRWEIESVLGEIKTCQRGAGVVLASKARRGRCSGSGRTCWCTMRCAR